MSNYSMFLPSYSVGVDCYKEIPYITRRYGKKAVVIGGKTAMEKVKEDLLEAILDSNMEILDFIWFGGDSTYENIEMLKKNPSVQAADIIFGVGGGRACDTAKTLADMEDKPLFTFPTLASNCAASTAVSVIYNPDATFKEYYYMKAPSLHTFINTKIIANSPEKLLWAGIGDALSKECEVLFASRDKFMYHTPLMGVCIAKICTDPLIEYGKKALEDCKNNIPSFELEQVALDIIISTGIVSNFATHEAQPDPNDNYYYNSSIAHCIYYGTSMIPACEKYLHGEIVAFGVLCLLTYDNQIEERDRIMSFNKSIGLPITLKEIGITESDLAKIAKKAAGVVEWSYVPGVPTEEKLIKAIKDTDAAGKKFCDYNRLANRQ
ncbi:iron-containing alcohol dehydrogenase family protein [Paenibacillus caui]|uniref:iron-containing alcohol dehydrogenase family protein n=1 Tax=Paenibacillus caui TaxID=2873927 RepID=UPI001CA8A8F7|nr:iron-containing alcohol dehydrogenase family protein [Paenibacillus caui]